MSRMGGKSEIGHSVESNGSRHSIRSRALKWRLIVVFLLGGSALVAAIVIPLYFYVLGRSTDDSPEATEFAIPAPQDLAVYAASLSASGDPYFGTKQSAYLLEELNNPSFDSHSWFITIHTELARDRLRFGDAEEAIRLLTEALEVEEQNHPEEGHLDAILEALAVTYLKLGELNNCLSPDGRLICTLPLDRTLVHGNKRGSTNAIKYLLLILERHPEDLRARWLLNIAHMTLGTYPEQVPSRFVIPRELLETSYEMGRFQEIAPSVGLYKVNPAGGSIVEDFDNDGLLDIMTSTWDPGGPITYYHNDGNGRFSDHTEKAGLAGQLGGLNIVQTDFNNDGWMDVLVMRGGWMRTRGQMRVSLLRNNGDGTFADVTHQAELVHPAYPSQSATWADFDNDGDLDLFSCNESMPRPGSIIEELIYPSQLFNNNDDETFTDTARQAGVTNLRYCKGSAWGDYDRDGDPDLYLSNFGDENRLYRNNGDGTFTDVATELGVVEPINSFGTWFWDFNNDGWLDLFVAGYGLRIADVAADYLGLPHGGARTRLYKNDGAGRFIDVTRETGLYRVHLTMGANFGDLDNDGFLDMYLGTGYPSYDALGPNIAYRNNGGQSFTDVTFSAGLGHLQKGHGISFGDLDRDGDQDIFVQVGGFYPGDGFINALYENPGHGNRWVSVRLVGVESNRAAIGARIKLELEMNDGTLRSVYSQVTSGGSFGASSLEQQIGLGQAQRIISMEIYWPTSDTRQVFTDVPLEIYIEVREGDRKYKVLDIPTLDFHKLP